jgi:hypothetical protein
MNIVSTAILEASIGSIEYLFVTLVMLPFSLIWGGDTSMSEAPHKLNQVDLLSRRWAVHTGFQSTHFPD